MGHPKRTFRSKAARLMSDFTSVILNPISDHPSKTEPTKEGDGTMSPKSPDGGLTDGPDTSSFSAFMVSLLSTEESGSHPNELNEDSAETEPISSTSTVKETGGKKSMMARGKQSVGKVINKAARMSGYRYFRTEKKTDATAISDTNSTAQELTTLKVTNETTSQIELPDISEPSSLLSETLRSTLYASLPLQAKGKIWVLLYSTWRHGISLSTLYRRSMICPGHNLLIVGDQKGAVFGGLVEAPLVPTTKKKYQGTHGAFVFSDLSNPPVIFRPTGDSKFLDRANTPKKDDQLSFVQEYAGANRYFTRCSADYLALGGGGHFALYLNEDLLSGSSSASDTFGNPCLAHTQDFNIKEVELWGFVSASKCEETLELCRTDAPGICRW